LINMTKLDKLNVIFCEVLADEDIGVNLAMTVDDVDGWDSLSQINRIRAIEGNYGIRFAQKGLLTLKNVGDLMNCIDRKQAEN